MKISINSRGVKLEYEKAPSRELAEELALYLGIPAGIMTFILLLCSILR